LFEVFGSEMLSALALPRTTIWLTAWAILVLAVGRGMWNRLGTSTLIGCFAALFKLANAAPYYCHLLGIVALAIAFDAASTFLLSEKRTNTVRSAMVGVSSTLVGAAAFAILSRFVFANHHWIEGGWARFADHVFVTGGVAAVFAAVLCPLAFWLASQGSVPFEDDSRLALGVPIAASICIWILAGVY
jgi:hypothetical protein